MKKKSKKGNLIWITGLSGSGKTLIARKLKQKLLKKKKNYLLINGDGLRSIFELKKYDRNSRINYAYSYSKLCKKIVDLREFGALPKKTGFDCKNKMISEI